MVGDSIIDSNPYVDEGHDTCSVLERQLTGTGTVVDKIAVDGFTTDNVLHQLKYLKSEGYGSFNKEKTVAVLSVGGNDALQLRGVLYQPVQIVAQAFTAILEPLRTFRSNYSRILETLIENHEKVIAMTVYNKIPIGVTEEEFTALSLFNDIITEEVGMKKSAGANIDLLDLRVVCDEAEDYSDVSPIEPSHQGSQKIVKHLLEKL